MNYELAYRVGFHHRDVSVGLIESDDPALVDRLTETFDEYREASTRLTTSELINGQESV